jgi:predicted nucleic acid-binding protein
MQVAKWGNSLAVRLPAAAVVEALETCEEGDDIEIEVAGARAFAIRKEPDGRASCWPGCGRFAAGCPPISRSSGWKPMRGTEAFFDTNVLLYLLSGRFAAKADRAEAVLAGAASISVQVLNEFACGRPRASTGLTVPRNPRRRWNPFATVCAVEPLTLEIARPGAGQLAERFGFALYDARRSSPPRC